MAEPEGRDPAAELTEKLADLAARQADVRSRIAASPLGRHQAGVRQARDLLQRALDDLTARRLAVALTAALDEDEDALHAQLSDLDVEEVTAMARAAVVLARVAWAVVGGRR